ncbi:hypothetical protein S40288_11732 [Stachybotrys chartarum IBT 40288]|nr:hypothetical protein S40288_11732 [Stachybotrys chartarum IBT 40288]
MHSIFGDVGRNESDSTPLPAVSSSTGEMSTDNQFTSVNAGQNVRTAPAPNQLNDDPMDMSEDENETGQDVDMKEKGVAKTVVPAARKTVGFARGTRTNAGVSKRRQFGKKAGRIRSPSEEADPEPSKHTLKPYSDGTYPAPQLTRSGQLPAGTAWPISASSPEHAEAIKTAGEVFERHGGKMSAPDKRLFVGFLPYLKKSSGVVSPGDHIIYRNWKDDCSYIRIYMLIILFNKVTPGMKSKLEAAYPEWTDVSLESFPPSRKTLQKRDEGTIAIDANTLQDHIQDITKKMGELTLGVSWVYKSHKMVEKCDATLRQLISTIGTDTRKKPKTFAEILVVQDMQFTHAMKLLKTRDETFAASIKKETDELRALMAKMDSRMTSLEELMKDILRVVTEQ